MSSAYFLETGRLRFRPLTHDDRADVAALLKDEETMRRMHFHSTDELILAWLVRAIERNESRGYSHWHVSRKEDDCFVGIIGVIPEPVEGVEYTGLGYLIHPDFRRLGYALEGARACIGWAFANIDTEQVIAEIAADNLPSIRLAERLGMSFVREYPRPSDPEGVPHRLYSITRETYEERSE